MLPRLDVVFRYATPFKARCPHFLIFGSFSILVELQHPAGTSSARRAAPFLSRSSTFFRLCVPQFLSHSAESYRACARKSFGRVWTLWSRAPQPSGFHFSNRNGCGVGASGGRRVTPFFFGNFNLNFKFQNSPNSCKVSIG